MGVPTLTSTLGYQSLEKRLEQRLADLEARFGQNSRLWEAATCFTSIVASARIVLWYDGNRNHQETK
jgi:hypothetical protein